MNEDNEALVLKLVEDHKRQWSEITVLRNEALKMRAHSVQSAVEYSRLAKSLAELTNILQAGERKAFGMDKENDAQKIVIERLF